MVENFGPIAERERDHQRVTAGVHREVAPRVRRLLSRYGVCIRRMDLCLPVEDFVGSELCREIVRLREDEYLRLSAMSRVTAKA